MTLAVVEVPEEKKPEEAPEAPRFTQTLQTTLDVFQGSTVTVECVVVGRPQPTVTWYKVRPEPTHTQIHSGITLEPQYYSTNKFQMIYVSYKFAH